MEKLKLSFLIPSRGVCTDNKNWLWWVYKELRKTNDVFLNDCSADCDCIIGMSISQIGNIKKFHSRYPKIPLITYNWDWFSWVDKTKYPWNEFTQLMKESIEVWAASYDVAATCERETRIKSKVVYMSIIPEEWKQIQQKETYVVMASRRVWYKRFDWFEKACQELKIPFYSLHPAQVPRKEFLKIVAKAKIFVSLSLYEGLGLTPFEAAYNKIPILLADTDVFKELWEDKAIFFEKNNYQDFKMKLKEMYFKGLKNKTEMAYQMVKNEFLPEHAAQRINNRLYETIKSK